MILGIGTDVVRIERVRDAHQRYGHRWVERVLSPREREEMAACSVERQVEYLAGRFAAKEAIAKAAGCGLGNLRMTTVDIHLGSAGLSVSWLDMADRPYCKGRWHVSISHDAGVAFAVAVWEDG